MALSTPIASLDQSLPPAEQAVIQWKRDVFLSFRGADTRLGITTQLFTELKRRRINTFKDDKELKVGMTISPSLLKAIEESRFAIVVLSPNYATSPWCLDELVKIFQCMEGKETILPLFYKVEPSDVRYQNNSYQAAFAEHEKNSRQSKEKVKEWRAALKKIAQISGWELKNYESEGELVGSIVEFVCSKVQPIDFEAIMSAKGYETFESTRRATDGVVNALKDDKVKVIGVYGIGGVGKTTMVKHISSQAQKDGLFDYIIMAVVSQNPNVAAIQVTLADMLRLEWKSNSPVIRAAELKERIIKGNKILIIFDDIWNAIDLSSIGIPNQDELHKCNSKILFTTRSLSVCIDMGSQAKIPLQSLSDEDSWSLFVIKARSSFHESTKFYNVARKVAKECGGLPVALIAVAVALGDKKLEEWEAAVEYLEKSQMTNLDQKGDVFRCIKLSYDYLKSDDAKECFLLCCLFPEDYDIQVENLIMYGIGSGLFRDSNTIQEARATASSVVTYLLASSLLLVSEVDGCVKMHDVIRDMAISISLSEDSRRCFVKAGMKLKEWPKITAHPGYSAISLLNNDIFKFPEKLVCLKLHILLLGGNSNITEIPNTFFETLNELRVLDLSRTSISTLPRSLGLQTKLQALYINHCDRIVNFSILRELKTIEILSMRYFGRKELPKEIGELSNLRMLDIGHAKIEIIPSGVLSKLSGLEELHMQCDFEDWGRDVDEGCLCCIFCQGTNADFDEITCMPHLNTLGVFISNAQCLPEHVERIPNWTHFQIFIGRGTHSFPLDYSRDLVLGTSMDILPDWFIEAVTEKAVQVKYYFSWGINNFVLEHQRGRLNGLKALEIRSGLRQMTVLLDTTSVQFLGEPVFENLEELDVRRLVSLTSLCHGELPPGSLRNLKKLVITDCWSLSYALLPTSLWQKLQNLETLTCVWARQRRLKYVFESEEQEPVDQAAALKKLREIKLDRLDGLIYIWQLGPNKVPPAAFHNLTVLDIDECGQLKSLFTTTIAQCLSQLEVLRVSKCGNLARIIRDRDENADNDLTFDEDDYTSEEESGQIIVFPKLKKLGLFVLPKLIGFVDKAGHTIESPSLQQLQVRDCQLFSTCISHFRSNYQVQELD